MKIERTDVAIIGGGYYGAFVANEIKSQQPGLDVTIFEKEDRPFTQASSTNQGQFHMGYFYSGDPELGHECVKNMEKFSDTFGAAVDGDVTSYYAVHKDSNYSADEYAGFCDSLGLPLRIVEDRPKGLFSADITTAFVTAEKTFNSARLQNIFLERLSVNGVRLETDFDVKRVAEGRNGLQVIGANKIVEADRIFNVTFADINGLHERSDLPKIPVKNDTMLHFILGLPDGFESTSATVLRGPYASLMASSFRQGHLLASAKVRKVRSALVDRPPQDVTQEEIRARYEEAIADAAAYMPVLGLAKYKGYTLGTRTAHFDPDTGAHSSKALVFENFGGVANYHAILGGKVSCMFDIAAPVKRLIE